MNAPAARPLMATPRPTRNKPEISNRELELLEPLLTYTKQTTAPRPNRELSTILCPRSPSPPYDNKKAEACSLHLTLRASAFGYSDCVSLLHELIDCSIRPDDLSRCPHVRTRVRTENPSSNPAFYCRPSLSSLNVLLHCKSSIGLAPDTFYSEVPVISSGGKW
jgi:hypothetical protein